MTFINSFFYSKIPDIPINIIDNNTFIRKNYPDKFHTNNSHMFCIILRIFISLIIFSNLSNSVFNIILAIIIIILFASTLYNKSQNKLWKNYMNTILIYIYILFINIFNYNNINTNKFTGILILFDVLMSQQSRHTATLFKK